MVEGRFDSSPRSPTYPQGIPLPGAPDTIYRGEDVSKLQELAARFPAGAHKTRRQAGRELTYLSIDAVLNRLNEVLGSGWSNQATTQLIPQEDGTFLAVCELQLSAQLEDGVTTRYGVGAMVNKDPDMASKTALAEAIKKAGHAFGIGLYLWDEGERGTVERLMKLDGATTATLKQQVFRLAAERLGKDKPTAADIGALFGVKPTDLSERAILMEILTEES